MFHGDSGTLGLLISAAGLGAASGIIYLAFRPSVRGLFRLIAWTSAIAGTALIVFSLSPALWVALPALYAVGLGLFLSAASTNTVLQTIVPDELRGRVASLYVVAFIGVAPVGALLGGWIAEHAGPPATLAGCGIVTVLGAIAYARALPAIQREIRPLYREMGILTTDTAGRPDQ
jgi:MFS family permease